MLTPVPTDPTPDIIRPPTPVEEPQRELPVGIPEPGPDIVTPPPQEAPPARPDEIPPNQPSI